MSIFDNQQQLCRKLTDVYVNEYIIPVQYSDHSYESQNMAQNLTTVLKAVINEIWIYEHDSFSLIYCQFNMTVENIIHDMRNDLAFNITNSDLRQIDDGYMFELCGQTVWDGEIEGERLALEPFRACKVTIFRTIHDIYDKI